MYAKVSKLRQLMTHPRYSFMRAFARFNLIRMLVINIRRLLHIGRFTKYLENCEKRMHETQFPNVDKQQFVNDLLQNGAAFGLKLPQSMVNQLINLAKNTPCYADREVDKGFLLNDKAKADEVVKKPILLAQYFNTLESSPEINKLANDPLLNWIAAKFIGSIPVFVGANMWWTFPVNALAEDKDLHAHLFHRDLDDFRFFKFFFYLTDVQSNDGAHTLVVGSQNNPPLKSFVDLFKVRRYSDSEIAQYYEAEDIKEICAPAGTGFAENTLCIHKGLTPQKEPRLLLQLQFALFDYCVTDDKRHHQELKLIVA